MTRPAMVLLGAVLALSGLAAAQSPPPNVVTSLTLFAGTSEGFFRTGDWGRTWEPLKYKREEAEPLAFGSVWSVLPVGPHVYAGGTDGLALSDDFGQTWRAMDVGTTALAVLPSRYPQVDPTILVGTAGGLLKSLDGGRTFQPTALKGAAVLRIEWPGPALVLGTSQGVRVSQDSAASLVEVGTGAPSGGVQALALSAFYAVDPVLFAGFGMSGVYRSPDGGKTWLPAGLEGHGVTDLVWLGPFLYAVSDRGVFRSEDLGKTWTPLNTGLKDAVPSRILFPLAPAAGAEAFLATDRGIFHTPDGGQHWSPAGLAGQKVVSLGTFPAPSPVSGKSGKKKK
jgi:photosystem II stability/assembly factor-like uncharacterized protein